MTARQAKIHALESLIEHALRNQEFDVNPKLQIAYAHYKIELRRKKANLQKTEDLAKAKKKLKENR